MKKLLLISISIITAFTITGCYSEYTTIEDIESAENSSSRFIVIESNFDYKIAYDKETMVVYSISQGERNSGNMTVLVNADGSPLLYQPK